MRRIRRGETLHGEHNSDLHTGLRYSGRELDIRPNQRTHAVGFVTVNSLAL